MLGRKLDKVIGNLEVEKQPRQQQLSETASQASPDEFQKPTQQPKNRLWASQPT